METKTLVLAAVIIAITAALAIISTGLQVAQAQGNPHFPDPDDFRFNPQGKPVGNPHNFDEGQFTGNPHGGF